jgi:hypothetical protein
LKKGTGAEDVFSDSDIDKLSNLSDLSSNSDEPDVNANPKIKSMTQTLRGRGDVAKYLQGMEGSYYDGKSRALREEDTDRPTVEYKGDNAKVYTGQYLDLIDQTNFTK